MFVPDLKRSHCYRNSPTLAYAATISLQRSGPMIYFRVKACHATSSKVTLLVLGFSYLIAASDNPRWRDIVAVSDMIVLGGWCEGASQ